MINFIYVDPDSELEINCFLEYTPAEYGRRENGLQIEPDFQEEVMLVRAWINNTYDLLPLLNEETIDHIENKFISERNND